MTYLALGLIALYVPFGLLFYGLASAARRADSLDARARAIAKQNLRRRRAALVKSSATYAQSALAVV